jgi:phage tail protein X
LGYSYADFAQSYDPLNSYSQGAGGGRYEVQAGDTLQSIAQSVYGDANLWYKIAQANGLSGAGHLAAGTALSLPSGITRSSFNAGTVTPYNAGEAIGDTSPTNAKPPKKNKCGVFGQILLAVIAIAVTYFTAGAATAALGPVLGGAAAGAAGSVVSQVVGVATGIQDKFSFKAVALAALGGAVGAGIKELGVFSKLGIGGNIAGSEFLGNVARGAVSSAINQGIGVATGLQEKFSWAGVAAAGVGAGVGAAFAKEAFGVTGDNFADNVGGDFQKAATGAVSAIANAATRSALTGESFGDGLQAAIPDVVAQLLFSLGSRGVSSLAKEIAKRSAKANDNPVSDHSLANTLAEKIEIQIVGNSELQTLSLDYPSARYNGDDYTFDPTTFDDDLEVALLLDSDIGLVELSFSDSELGFELDEASLDATVGVLATSGGSRPNPRTGLIRGTDGEIDLSLITSADHIRLREAASLFDIPDIFTVLGHGPSLSMRVEGSYPRLTQAERWSLISENRGDRPVLLLSCRTASANEAWVQKLSDDLGGVPVMAATSQTWSSRDGDVVIVRAYWSTNGVGQANSGTRDPNLPGQFRIFGGDITDFGFRALPQGTQIREIHVNSQAHWATVIAYDSSGQRYTRTRHW